MCDGGDRDLSFRHKHTLYLIMRKCSWSLRAVCVGSTVIVVSLSILSALSMTLLLLFLTVLKHRTWLSVFICKHYDTIVGTESRSHGGLVAWIWLLLKMFLVYEKDLSVWLILSLDCMIVWCHSGKHNCKCDKQSTALNVTVLKSYSVLCTVHFNFSFRKLLLFKTIFLMSQQYL